MPDKAPSPRQAGRPPIDSRFAAARVLVVDDVEANRDLLRRRLNRFGITSVFEAEDGAQALEVIRSRQLDLVLLDIMMPIMTGFDVLEVLAREKRIEQLPVIIISAMNEMASTVRAIELGAEDFLMKPFDPTLLRARVLATLEKKLLRDALRDDLARQQAELSEARHLQMALTPPAYQAADVSIEVILEPAREVGGDLVDHIVLGDGRHLIALGDVSGKGAGAALMMARCHALVRSLVSRADADALLNDIGLAASTLNAELATANPRCMFITLFLGVYDPRSGQLDYVRCGHVPPFLRRSRGAVERLDTTRGLPLGLDEAATYRAASEWLGEDDCLLVISDGVTEAASPDDQLFDDRGVQDWFCGPDKTLAALVAEVRRFEAGQPAADDLCALLLRRSAPRPQLSAA